MRLLITATVLGMCLGSCLAARASDPVVCSGFDARGDAATVTLLQHKLSLQIAPASGAKLVTLTASIHDDGLLDCSVFFDRENRYVAVGVYYAGLKTGPLNIIVADLGADKIISNFAVQPTSRMGLSPILVGFWKDSSSLTVFGSGALDQPTKSIWTTLFSVTGKQENSRDMRTLPTNTFFIGDVSFVDAAHNRFWLESSPQPCPLRSFPLIGNGPVGVAADQPSARAACDADRAIGYPNENTLITAVTRGPNDLVTRVDLGRHSAEQLVLPATGRRIYTQVEQGFLSPGGQIFAISRELLSNSFLGDGHIRGMEVDAVQVSPLKFLGKVRLKPDTDSASISIEYRKGHVKVLYFEDGKWKSEHLKVQ